MKKEKIIRIVLAVIGTLLGGKLGVITACTAGPVIQFFSGIVEKSMKKFWRGTVSGGEDR